MDRGQLDGHVPQKVHGDHSIVMYISSRPQKSTPVLIVCSPRCTTIVVASSKTFHRRIGDMSETKTSSDRAWYEAHVIPSEPVCETQVEAEARVTRGPFEGWQDGLRRLLPQSSLTLSLSLLYHTLPYFTTCLPSLYTADGEPSPSEFLNLRPCPSPIFGPPLSLAVLHHGSHASPTLPWHL